MNRIYPTRKVKENNLALKKTYMKIHGEIAIFVLKLSPEAQIGPSTFKTSNLVPKQSIFSQSRLLLLTTRHVSRKSCQKSFLPLPPSFMSHVRCIQREKL